MAGVRKEGHDREQKVDGEFSKLRRELSNERQQRAEAYSQIEKKLDNVAVGGLHLDIIGLWWLLSPRLRRACRMAWPGCSTEWWLACPDAFC